MYSAPTFWVNFSDLKTKPHQISVSRRCISCEESTFALPKKYTLNNNSTRCTRKAIPYLTRTAAIQLLPFSSALNLTRLFFSGQYVAARLIPSRFGSPLFFLFPRPCPRTCIMSRRALPNPRRARRRCSKTAETPKRSPEHAGRQN